MAALARLCRTLRDQVGVLERCRAANDPGDAFGVTPTGPRRPADRPSARGVESGPVAFLAANAGGRPVSCHCDPPFRVADAARSGGDLAA